MCGAYLDHVKEKCLLRKTEGNASQCDIYYAVLLRGNRGKFSLST